MVDGGLRDRALGFLFWNYRLDQPNNNVVIDHLFLSHADQDHAEGLILLLNHPQITVQNIYHNGIGLFSSGFAEEIGDVSNDGRLITLHSSTAHLNGVDAVNGVGFSARAMALLNMAISYPERLKSMVVIWGQLLYTDKTIGLFKSFHPDSVSASMLNNISSNHEQGEEQARSLLSYLQVLPNTGHSIAPAEELGRDYFISTLLGFFSESWKALPSVMISKAYPGTIDMNALPLSNPSQFNKLLIFLQLLA